MSTNGEGRYVTDRCAARVAAAERLARAIVLAFETCDEGGVPLSQVQRVAVIEAGLLEFDGLERDLRSSERVAELLRALGRI
jgi:hypothetical protein